MKKRLDVAAITNELKDGSVFFRRPVEKPSPSSRIPTRNIRTSSPQVAQNIAQSDTQLSKAVSNTLLNNLSSDEIEALSFRLRKVTKTKVNAEVPEAWKDKLDDLAHALGIGKYELVMYIIGRFLGEAR